MTTFAGKVAVVTGAAGTIGLAVARMLLEEGAKVALVDVDAMRLDGLVRFLRGETTAIACDVRDPMAVRQSHQQVEQALGAVDILVNAATASGADRLESLADDAWREAMAVNADGAFHWSRAVIPAMRKRGWGRIVNVSALSAMAAGPAASAAESAAKGAVESLPRALARETAAQGITVNAVAPAYVKSPQVGQMNEAQRRQLLTQIPVGRFCEPEEFAHAVRFLVSPLSGFITGEILDVNGGMLMD
jgi:3-oxoacyl-[acyl-carrier protein] reductase